MNLTDFWWSIGDILEWSVSILFDNVTLSSLFNNGVILLGFVGLFIWLSKQKKFNDVAEANPDQLK